MLSTLIPFNSAKSMRTSKNLKEGDIIMLMFESKIAASYRLAKVVEAVPSPIVSGPCDSPSCPATFSGMPKDTPRSTTTPRSMRCRISC